MLMRRTGQYKIHSGKFLALLKTGIDSSLSLEQISKKMVRSEHLHSLKLITLHKNGTSDVCFRSEQTLRMENTNKTTGPPFG